MDLRHLRYFVAVAEELHFSRAASKLHISQPPLSQQIKELEEEVGAQLLRRTRRRVELTAAGNAFLKRARMILREAAELGEAARRAERGEVGHISVGFIHTAGYGLLPAVIREFRDANPTVEVALQQQGSLAQTGELERGSIDIGFTWSNAVEDHIESQCLLRERFVLALPRTHAAAGKRNVGLKAFAQESFVSFPQDRSPALYATVIQLCASAGFVPRIRHEADSVHTVLGLVAAGCGIGLVPASATEVRMREVAFCLPKESNPKAEISIQWRRNDESPVLLRFIASARATAHRYRANSLGGPRRPQSKSLRP
jgi:DNA-binding transcriptional LysR family regulator